MRKRVRALVQRLISDRRGATVIEYGLIASLIGAGIVFLVLTIGQTLTNFFTSVGSGLTTVS